MRLACLFSGGKDSTYAIYDSINQGHEIKCLVTLIPPSSESFLFHYPNVKLTPLVADAMRIPHLMFVVTGVDMDTELEALEVLLRRAKIEYGVEGIVHGGISSEFQKSRFSSSCSRCDLHVISPVWRRPAVRYMRDLISNGFKVLITSVSAMGLDKCWLGKTIDEDVLEQLMRISERNGFNLNFEGGEAETIVLDSPLHKDKLDIVRSKVRWDGQRGMFEILEVALVSK
jgi:diphthine-ammonia ligase